MENTKQTINIDHRGRQIFPIPENTASKEILPEASMRYRDFVECVFKSYSGSQETFGDPDLLDVNRDSKELHLWKSRSNLHHRSYDVLYFPSGELKPAKDESEFHYIFSPTDEGFRFFDEYEETEINYEEISRSIHIAESIVMAVDETTRHCRSVYNSFFGSDEAIENETNAKNTHLKDTLRKNCSKKLTTIANASRRLISCPVAHKEDIPSSQKVWKICKESTFALQHRCKELERTISLTAAKTKQIIEKRKKEEKALMIKSKPSSFESRQADAQRLRALIQQKHNLKNVGDRHEFNQEGFNTSNKVQEDGQECVLVPEETVAWENIPTGTWEKIRSEEWAKIPAEEWETMLQDFSTTDQNAAMSVKSNAIGSETTSSPDSSTSESSIEKLSAFLDQYLEQQKPPAFKPQPRKPKESSKPSSKESNKSTGTSSLDKLSALLGDYFDQKPTKTVPPSGKKKQCKVIIEDASFHEQVKKSTESLSYSSGLTECSSEDSSIDCSAIVQHENNVMEQFGAYQAEFDLYTRELEAGHRQTGRMNLV